MFRFTVMFAVVCCVTVFLVNMTQHMSFLLNKFG
jgi:hypothetical protein